jgi:hypothetical protein
MNSGGIQCKNMLLENIFKFFIEVKYFIEKLIYVVVHI